MVFRFAVVAFTLAAASAKLFADPTTDPAPATPTTTTSPATGPTTAASKYAKVEKGLLKLSVHASGTFEPVDPLEVKIKCKAFAGEFNVISAAAPGAVVHAGDTILECDATQFHRQLIAADAEVAVARSSLEKAEADRALGEQSDALALTMAENDVKVATDSLAWWEKVDGAQLLRNADLSVKYAKDAVDDQQDELDQLKKMYKSEELTSATADIVVKRAIRNLERAKTGLEETTDRAAKTKENDYEANHARWKFAVDQQKQALDRLKVAQAQAKILRSAGLTAAQQAVQAADEKRGNLKLDESQFTIKSPGDLTIYYGSISSGSWADANPRPFKAGDKVADTAYGRPSASTVLMTGVQSGHLRLTAQIPEAKILLVTDQLKATIQPTALPQLQIAGTCGPPDLEPGGDRSFDVPIEFEKTDSRIIPGMKAAVTLGGESSKEKVLRIPLTAIRSGKVWLHADHADEARSVEIGRCDGEFVEVLSGLSEGDEVIAKAPVE